MFRYSSNLGWLSAGLALRSIRSFVRRRHGARVHPLCEIMIDSQVVNGKIIIFNNNDVEPFTRRARRGPWQSARNALSAQTLHISFFLFKFLVS